MLTNSLIFKIEATFLKHTDRRLLDILFRNTSRAIHKTITGRQRPQACYPGCRCCCGVRYGNLTDRGGTGGRAGGCEAAAGQSSRSAGAGGRGAASPHISAQQSSREVTKMWGGQRPELGCEQSCHTNALWSRFIDDVNGWYFSEIDL